MMMLTNSGPMSGTVFIQTFDKYATKSEDYVPIHKESISIGGYQSKQASITILDDNQVEEDEDLFVEITGAAVGEGITVVNITIVDNDPSIVFVAARSNIIESARTFQVHVANNGSVTGTAYITSSDVSATENEDYGSIKQLAVTVEAKETQSITIHVLDDNLVEFEETFLVKLSGDDVGIDGIKTMEIIIEDEDASINFVSSTAEVDEASGIVILTLQNNGSADGTVFLQTKDISTKEDIDYKPIWNVPISVALGTPKEVSVVVHDDTAIETKESFVVVINGTDVGEGIHMVKVTISDDDVLKSPKELFDERIVNAIKEIEALPYPESKNEISASIFDSVFEDFLPSTDLQIDDFYVGYDADNNIGTSGGGGDGVGGGVGGGDGGVDDGDDGVGGDDGGVDGGVDSGVDVGGGGVDGGDGGVGGGDGGVGGGVGGGVDIIGDGGEGGDGVGGGVGGGDGGVDDGDGGVGGDDGGVGGGVDSGDDVGVGGGDDGVENSGDDIDADGGGDIDGSDGCGSLGGVKGNVNSTNNGILSVRETKVQFQSLDRNILAEGSLSIIAALSLYIPEDENWKSNGTGVEDWPQINIETPGITTTAKRLPAHQVSDGFEWSVGNNTWVRIAGDVLESLPPGNKVITLTYIDSVNKAVNNGFVNVSGASRLWQIVTGTIGVRLLFNDSAYSIPIKYGLPIQVCEHKTL
ncbi:uncharacterized protein [Amphiura filiformis]|uniref:uncharacterized protein n=1 Tax=Amphiura filiformis TaxID=82378 RepID=UPI003B21DEFC